MGGNDDRKAKIILCGTDDDFTSETSFANYVKQMQNLTGIVMIEDIDDGWWKKK